MLYKASFTILLNISLNIFHEPEQPFKSIFAYKRPRLLFSDAENPELGEYAASKFNLS
jgi:hypothetical protein